MYVVVLPVYIFSLRKKLHLKSDGHGNGGTLINGNGGTYYHLSKFRQPLYIIKKLYRLFASIYIYLNIFWKQWNTFSLVSMVLFEV